MNLLTATELFTLKCHLHFKTNREEKGEVVSIGVCKSSSLKSPSK